MPETIASKTVFKGRVFDVTADTIRENDSEYIREIITHNGSSVIVPVFEDQTIGLVRQYRHAAGKYLLEIPAGGMEDGESPEEGAIRELEEEMGVTAARVEKLLEFYPSPGFLAEKMFLFIATGLTETKQSLDEDEFVEIVRVTFPAAREMIQNGQIEDAKTIIGITAAANRYWK